MKSQAIVFTGIRQIEVREVTLKPMGPTDVLVDTCWSSISTGTEKMAFNGLIPSPPFIYPFIPGYETVGKITDVGDHVNKSLVGKYAYIAGSFGYTDVNAAFGGASSAVVCPVESITVLDGIDDPKCGIALPLGATALHFMDLADVKGKKVLVLGQGAVGILAVQLARHMGATLVAATEPYEKRLGYSEADLRVNPQNQDVSAALAGHEFDIMIDSTGVMNAIETGLRFLKFHGKVIFGGYYQRMNIDYSQAFEKELSFIAAKQWAKGDLVRVRELIRQGSLHADRIFTHSHAVDNNLEEAYQQAFSDPDCLKMILNWKENE
ncbi:chlorophyll synthesis pathway protein BchC [Prosthecochloris sp. N3]|uniref:Chlorophyll synthesis pathway protein BchC n=1 Tax=Prosthecochloris ethylica TaxID=2743976 RepID=A0ABR9XR89_9CHLB|nr:MULTISPECIES: chlorophyll synthesis pathway protein BchC [Prosthecochloris]MEC9486796.1 chlorophyll synthesis pathway protein BchC [Prosthecochloris sp.]MBF0585540.1 chlorophyll synthesis pathway protein BchC [Prosthecochloris ethylica]MBF0636326.1 chlorophyll synthesis pathway protein BchC [Prosthecochloris ethylica]NUK46770.1 chlorophyll synthesis pathway protein BchC [Prosthecochloris ethylica]RNA65813.1 chlorophyll synthesis pathway protein BchC [Prosthecochloris sp. ZM_2]